MNSAIRSLLKYWEMVIKFISLYKGMGLRVRSGSLI
jgi:hypothetical protein